MGTISFDEWLANVQKRQAERSKRVEAIEESWPEAFAADAHLIYSWGAKNEDLKSG